MAALRDFPFVTANVYPAYCCKSLFNSSAYANASVLHKASITMLRLYPIIYTPSKSVYFCGLGNKYIRFLLIFLYQFCMSTLNIEYICYFTECRFLFCFRQMQISFFNSPRLFFCIITYYAKYVNIRSEHFLYFVIALINLSHFHHAKTGLSLILYAISLVCSFSISNCFDNSTLFLVI